jgi:hypothetical protein
MDDSGKVRRPEDEKSSPSQAQSWDRGDPGKVPIRQDEESSRGRVKRERALAVVCRRQDGAVAIEQLQALGFSGTEVTRLVAGGGVHPPPPRRLP